MMLRYGMGDAARKLKLTVPEFLGWYAKQQGRYELVNGEPVAMAPGRVLHNITKKRVARALDDAVSQAGLPCTVLTDGIGVAIDETHWREPDAAVQCGASLDPHALMLDQPLIVVEVMSPSSERDDTTKKLPEYFSVASIAHYLIIDADNRLIIHHARSDGGKVLTSIIRSGAIVLQPPGLTVDYAAMLPPV